MRNGHIKRITDADIQSSVLEIAGTNVSTTYVTCPADPKKTLGIKLPFLVMIIKNVRCTHVTGAGPVSPRVLGKAARVCFGDLVLSPPVSCDALVRAAEEVLHV